MSHLLGRVALFVAVVYVIVLGWGMQELSYDVWGAMVVGPLMIVLTVPLLRRSLRGEPSWMFPMAFAGLLAKMAGSLVRYWVAFDAYGGAADAGRYHEFGRLYAADIRSGRVSLLNFIPSGTGTNFMDRLTATIYTVFGSSRLAGFLLFGWLGFWGALWFVRAAMVAIPGLAARRYAALIFFLPSLVYWPSSIGKEAWMCLCLGLASYGGARLLAGGNTFGSVVQVALGLTGAAIVRPHLAGMWLAGLAVALIAGLFIHRGGDRVRSRVATLGLLAVALVGLSFVAAFAIRYLEPGTDDVSVTVSKSIGDIFEETERRSEQGGSGFETIDLNGPLSWPNAIVRTMTRPLLNEAGSTAELLPALEMTSLVLAAVFGWRRFANIPHMLRKCPYLLFALSIVMMFGLAFTSIGNLGILTRQRSLALPLMVIPWCLPPLVARQRTAPTASPRPMAFASTRT